MVALYERSRCETLEGRVSALVQAATLRVQITVQEARANTGVLTTVPTLQDLLRSGSTSIKERRRMDTVFQAQLRDYERLNGLAVYGAAGQLHAEVNRPAVNLPDPLLRRALAQAEALHPRQIWVSSVQWPSNRPAEC